MSSPTKTVDELFAELATLTQMNPDEWRDFVSCAPLQQSLIAQTYRDASWVKAPDIFAKVVGVLEVLGTVAGVATSVAGAVSAIKALAA